MLHRSYINHIEKLEYFLEVCNIPNEYICLVGSSSLAVRGIRKNGDLDFAVHPKKRHKIKESVLPTDLSIQKNRYDFMQITDRKLIENSSLHDSLDGIKIVRPEITISFKNHRGKQKDERDVISLGEYSSRSNDWDWSTVYYDDHPDAGLDQTKSKLKERFSLNDSVILRAAESIRYNGYKYTAIRAAEEVFGKSKVERVINKRSNSFEYYHPGEILYRQYKGERFNGYHIALKRAMETGDVHLTPQNIDYKVGEFDQISLENIGPVRVDAEFRIINPSVFLAYLTREIRYIPIERIFDKIERDYNKEWLLDELDSNSDIKSVERHKNEILDAGGGLVYFISWGSMINNFDQIEEDIDNEYEVQENIIFDMSDNLEDFIEEAYVMQEASPFGKEWKKYQLSKFDPVIKLMKVEIHEASSSEKLFRQLNSFKHNLRENYYSDVPIGCYYSILHCSDNWNENIELRTMIDKYGASSH